MASVVRGLRTRIGLTAAVLLVFAAVALAQVDIPATNEVASVAVSESGPVSFASDGDFLLVADANELQLYDITEPDSPSDVITAEMESGPVAVAASAGYALAAVPAEGPTDILWVYAPDAYASTGFAGVNVFDIPEDPVAISLSPNHRWALVAGKTAFVTLDITAPDDIESSAFIEVDGGSLRDAALTNDHALVVGEGSSTIAVLSLTTRRRLPNAPDSIELDAPVTALTVNRDGTLGAAALEDDRLALLDLTTFSVMETIALEDGPVADLGFLTQDERTVLALLIPNRRGVMLVDVTDPENPSLPGSAVTDTPVTAMDALGDLLALASESGVSLQQLEPAE